jgi:hypothetical protein
MIQALFRQERNHPHRRLQKLVAAKPAHSAITTMGEIADTLTACAVLLETLDDRVRTISKENRTVKMTLLAFTTPGAITPV